ncbi:MAG: hypothetical protein ABIY52_00825 [Gemmatimonadaceae bacterium]
MAFEEDSGRIVVVAAGFALWKGGKCIAAARWADIRSLTAHRSSSGESVRLVVELMDGARLEFLEAAPGFDAFLDRASATLSGLLPFAGWHPKLMLAEPGGEGAAIFQRTSRY